MRGQGRLSHLRGVAQLALLGLRRRGRGPLRAQRGPARKMAVERGGLVATHGQLRRYLAATRGPETARYPPPGYSSIWETALALELLALEGMPFPSRGIVHLATELVVVRPLNLFDPVRARLELEGIEAHSRGAVLVLRFRCWKEAGQLCQENESRYLLPGVAPPPWTAGPPRPPEEPSTVRPPKGEWRMISTWDLPADAGLRYARASGDFNPVHLWPWTARWLGFPRPILHGHCTLAMVSHEIGGVSGAAPRKVSGRFRTPLELPATVRLETAGELESGSVRMRLMDTKRRGRPYLEGLWVGG